MKTTTIPRTEFDWPKFAGAIAKFAQSQTLGSVEPFVIAEHGKLVLDSDDLTLVDDEEIEDIPTGPIERLEAGYHLFAPFATFKDFGELGCADGDVIEVPDLDEEQDEDDEDDEETPQLTDTERELVEATVCDETHAYGFQIALDGDRFVFRSVLVNESDGGCDVEVVAHAGLVDEPLVKFLQSFARNV